MNEKFGPCLEKNCSWCCDPVKVEQTRAVEVDSTTDKTGKKIFSRRSEIYLPEKHMEYVKLATFDCANLDKSTGECADHENRPDMCKVTSCINEDSADSVDAQFEKTVNDKFIKIKI